MGIFTSLIRFFRNTRAHTRPMPSPVDHTGRALLHIPDAVKLEVSKAIAQLAFVDRSYHLGLWPSAAAKEDWKHDLGLMRTCNDLDHICLELLTADHTVLCAFRLTFHGRACGERITDSAHGIELPVLDRRVVTQGRCIIQRHGRATQYKDLLKLRWSPTATLPKQTGDSYESEHAAKITGGRQSGIIHVGAEARHRLVVTQTGTQGYAFATDLDLGADRIFLLPKFAAGALQFQSGQQLTAVVVQTPRGLQARNIQAA